MFLVDTNVIAEMRRGRTGRADANVIAWTDSIPAARLFLSVISVLEIEIGVLLAERRDTAQGAALRTWLDLHVMTAFAGRILPVDTAVVRHCARLHVPDKRPDRDALIAATAMVHGMTVVTRNVSDFASTGVGIINPWISTEST